MYEVTALTDSDVDAKQEAEQKAAAHKAPRVSVKALSSAWLLLFCCEVKLAEFLTPPCEL